jgi:AcrR family transcriptional regulator
LRQLIEAATRTFIARGYRLTQMSDVAAALGVAKGTLYGYVESKEALFDAAVRYADGHLPLPSQAELPLRTPPAGATVQYVRERIAAEAADLSLALIVSGRLAIRDPERELVTVLSDLYRRLADNRMTVKLVDRCAPEYPELAAVWFGEGRYAQQQLLAQLLEKRARRKRYRRAESSQVVARTVIESIAFWAMHRHFDASPQAVDDALAERTLIDLLVHGLLEKA